MSVDLTSLTSNVTTVSRLSSSLKMVMNEEMFVLLMMMEGFSNLHPGDQYEAPSVQDGNDDVALNLNDEGKEEDPGLMIPCMVKPTNLVYIRHGSYSPSVDPDDKDFDMDDENDKITWRHGKVEPRHGEVEPRLVKARFVFIVTILHITPAFTVSFDTRQ